jgi:hypothetical protein
MGLLNDAIREHLELKRRRGADAGEVAREEEAALGPLSDVAASATDEPEAPEKPLSDAEPGLADEPRWARAGDISHAGQETAELDMRTILGSAPEAYAEPRGMSREPRVRRVIPTPAGIRHPTSVPAAELDSLDWDSPDSRALSVGERTTRSLGLNR